MAGRGVAHAGGGFRSRALLVSRSGRPARLLQGGLGRAAAAAGCLPQGSPHRCSPCRPPPRQIHSPTSYAHSAACRGRGRCCESRSARPQRWPAHADRARSGSPSSVGRSSLGSRGCDTFGRASRRRQDPSRAHCWQSDFEQPRGRSHRFSWPCRPSPSAASRPQPRRNLLEIRGG